MQMKGSESHQLSVSLAEVGHLSLQPERPVTQVPAMGGSGPQRGPGDAQPPAASGHGFQDNFPMPGHLLLASGFHPSCRPSTLGLAPLAGNHAVSILGRDLKNYLIDLSMWLAFL